jgi:outer membrane protein assembly factor BamB
MEKNETVYSSPARKYGRRAIWGSVLGAGIIAALQWIAPSTDHQMANMACFVVGLVAILFAGLQLHFWSKCIGHGLRVPVIAMLIVLTHVALFRFDGFSGELLPQFKLRLASSAPELRELPSGNRQPDSMTSSAEESELVSDDQPTSMGFLGNQRDGKVRVRQFEVPTRVEELEIVWAQGIGQGWSSFAVASSRAVTLEQRDDMDCVTCYSLETGELLWMQSHQALHSNPMGGSGPRSTPTIVEDKVYAQDAEGLVWCLDLSTGKTHWSADLLELAGWTQAESEEAISWGRAGSPLIVDGLCVVPFGGPEPNAVAGRSLIALDAETGEVRWTAGADQISYASPRVFTLADQRQIVSVNEKTVSGHRIDDGTLLWEFDWPGQSNGGANCAMAMAAGKDRFLVGKGYGGENALVNVTRDEAGKFAATPVWTTTQFLKTKFTHACVDGDVAYAISNGSLEAIEVESCQRLWIQPRRSRFGQGQILLVDDVIVAQAESGEIAFVSATRDQYEELSRFPALSSKTWNIPTIAGRYLLVRNDRQAICYRLPAASR